MQDRLLVLALEVRLSVKIVYNIVAFRCSVGSVLISTCAVFLRGISLVLWRFGIGGLFLHLGYFLHLSV